MLRLSKLFIVLVLKKVFMKGLINFMKYVSKLKEVKRTGWVRNNIDNPESVADHSFSAAILGSLLCPEDLNKEKVMKMLLYHDLAESVTGDIVTIVNGEKESKT
jgi:5'-deoxynucleotidase YfbR-like HD superfamily hydrolase